MRKVVDMMKNLSLNLLNNAQNGQGCDRPSNQSNRDGMTRNNVVKVLGEIGYFHLHVIVVES